MRRGFNNEWIIFSKWETSECVRTSWANMLHLHQQAQGTNWALIRYSRVEAHIMNVLAACTQEFKAVAHLKSVGIRDQIQVSFLAYEWKHERVNRLLWHEAIREVLRSRHDVDIDAMNKRFDPIFKPRRCLVNILVDSTQHQYHFYTYSLLTA